MRQNPAFELLESLCVELAGHQQRVIDPQGLNPDLLVRLRKEFKQTADTAAVDTALAHLTGHFKCRESELPFTWQATTWEFTVTDAEFIAFVALAKNGRSVGGDVSKQFEVETARRLWKKLTGQIHRVGDPRGGKKDHRGFVKYLIKLGFEKKCLQARDKDGGFDILWLPPLGAVPIRPVVVFQCKNSYFNEAEATRSAGRARRTLRRHSHIRGHELVYAVFNDYIDEQYFGAATGWEFVPLGLSDLALTTYQQAPVIL